MDFALYGSWEALDRCKILSRGPLRFSTPGHPISENFFFEHFLTPSGALAEQVLSTMSAIYSETMVRVSPSVAGPKIDKTCVFEYVVYQN